MLNSNGSFRLSIVETNEYEIYEIVRSTTAFDSESELVESYEIEGSSLELTLLRLKTKEN